jgi:hypothetical protein
VPDQERFRLTLFVLGVIAVHALCLAALLPVLITLPGLDSSEPKHVDVDVDVLSSSAPPTSDLSDVTAALPGLPQDADPAPDETPTAALGHAIDAKIDASDAEPSQAPTAPPLQVTGPKPADNAAVLPDPDAVANIGPESSPTVMPEGTPEGATPADAPKADASPAEDQDVKPTPKVEQPSKNPVAKKRTAVTAKPAKPLVHRQAKAEATANSSESGSGSFFGVPQSQPAAKAKTQQHVTSGR